MKKQIKITKDNVIKEVAQKTNKSITDIRNFYNSLEEYVFATLSSVDENQDVCIKMFEGINLDGIYACEKVKKNNLTGETSFVKSKIIPKFRITRSYCEKLNNK